MANVARRDQEDLEDLQAGMVLQDLLECLVNAAWMDFQGLLFCNVLSIYTVSQKTSPLSSAVA